MKLSQGDIFLGLAYYFEAYLIKDQGYTSPLDNPVAFSFFLVWLA